MRSPPRGRRRGEVRGTDQPSRGARRNRLAWAKPPNATITSIRSRRPSSSVNQYEHPAVSTVRGMFRGGAHRTEEVTQQSRSLSPSSRATEVAWLANPARWSARYSQSPDRSPVNIRPVRLAPWAAGAKPTSTSRALPHPRSDRFPGQP